MRRGVRFMICEEEREAFKQDALRAWKEYQANGLHVTLEEADAWLAKLEAGENAEPPTGKSNRSAHLSSHCAAAAHPPTARGPGRR